MTGHHFDEQITQTVGGNTTKFEDLGVFLGCEWRASPELVAGIKIPNEDLIGNYEEIALLM